MELKGFGGINTEYREGFSGRFGRSMENGSGSVANYRERERERERERDEQARCALELRAKFLPVFRTTGGSAARHAKINM